MEKYVSRGEKYDVQIGMCCYVIDIDNVMFKLYCLMMELVTNLTFNDKYKYSKGICSCNKSQQDAQFLNFILVNNSTCFGQTYCPSSGVLILYSQQMLFVILIMLTVY